MTVKAEGPVRRLVTAIVRRPWPEMRPRILGAIVLGHVGMAAPLGILTAAIFQEPVGSTQDFLFWLAVSSVFRAITAGFWAIVLVTNLEQVRLAWLAGDRRRAAWICRIKGGGVVALLLLVHYCMMKFLYIEGDEAVSDLQLVQLAVVWLSTDFSLLCALLLALAARPLARGDWDGILAGNYPNPASTGDGELFGRNRPGRE